MSFTSPRTWVAGEIVTASLMNTHVKDNLIYLKGTAGVPTIESGLVIDNTGGDEYLKLPLLSTAECTSVLNAEGEVAFDEQTHRIKFFDNNSVVSVVGTDDVDDTPANGATTDPVSSNWAYDFINTLTTAGDIPYATGAGTWARKAIGTANQILRTNSGATAPEWATISVPTLVRKTADETVNNSTVLQNDDHLSLAVGANEVWEIDLYMRLTSSIAASLDYAFTYPAASTLMYLNVVAGGAYEVLAEVAATTEVTVTGAAADIRWAYQHLIYTGGANAGNIQLQWAQHAAEVSDTKVLTNSFLLCHKIA